MPNKRYTLGIDVGGTKVLVGLLDANFRLLSEAKLKSKPDKSEQYFLHTVAEAVGHVLHDAGVSRSDVVGIGVGCPGFIHEGRGIVIESPNLPFFRNYPLGRRLTNVLKLPAIIGNDVQTGLYGEHQFGAAKGHANVLGIFMGTGIGGALILNGQLYRGSTGSAGEIGHVQYDGSGAVCGCGRKGCFEAFAGRLAISSEAAIAVARQKAPWLAKKAGSDLREIKSGALARAIRAGDRAIADIIRSKAQIVGSMMANMVNFINPDLIVLGGGVVEAMPQLITREAERVMREQAIGPSARHVKVAVAQLKDYSIVMGAAKRSWDRFGEKRTGERRG
jgi:glucokinase